MQTIFSHLYCVAFLDYLLTKWNLTPGPSTQVFQPGTRFPKWAVLKIASANDEDDVIVCVCVCVCLCVCVSLRLLEASSLCVCVYVCLFVCVCESACVCPRYWHLCHQQVEACAKAATNHSPAVHLTTVSHQPQQVRPPTLCLCYKLRSTAPLYL